MQPIDEPGQQRLVSIPSLTAWLSLCILAAAWGRILDERWQGIWAYMGAFGLASSLGLSIIEKARLAHQEKLQNSALRSRIECGLEKLSKQGATLDSVNAAIRRLRAYAAHHTNVKSSAAGHVQQDNPSSPLSRLPMQISPVVEQDESSCELADAITGSLRDVSSSGVSFCHARPFIARVAVLTFELGESQRLSFVVDVLWTEALAEGFITGGTVLAVGVPEREERRRESLPSAANCPA